MVREIRPVERDDLEELTFDVPAVTAAQGLATSRDRPPRRPDQSATFEAQQLAGGKGRVPVVLAGWLGILALVAGAAFAGQRPEDGRDRIAAQVAVASDAPTAVRQPPQSPIDLLSPEVGPITISTARLTVKGALLVRASRVVVSLEARGNRTLDSVTFDLTDPHGGIRPQETPTFNAEFDIPFPRPNGTMWVVVTAYDSHLIPLGGERRPVRIGEIMGWPAAPGVG